MNNIIFKCLVIEDEKEFATRINYFEEMLLDDYNCNVEFKIIDDILKDDILDDFYDILLVDYNLNKISSENGDEIIKKIREKNKIVKIIFYSSQFIYDSDSEEYFFDNFPDDKIYRLINKYKVNKIVPRDDLNGLVESIFECCNDFDLTLLSLYKTIEEYYKKGITVHYKISDELVLKNGDIINEIKSDSDISKEIRNKIVKFSINNIFNFEY